MRRMRERLYVYDQNDTLITDPAESVEWATGLGWETLWPKGYGACSFEVRRDIARRWAVKQAHKLKILDGLRIVYEGRLNNLRRALREGEESILVDATGWYCRLVERKLHKRWVDIQALSLLEWPSGASRTVQELFVEERPNNDSVLVRFAAKDRTLTADTETYRLEYAMPHGSYVRRVTFDYQIRTGEGAYVRTWNVDQATAEDTISMTGTPSEVSGSKDITFSAGDTRKFEFRISPYSTDTYDQNDWVRISNLVIYSETALTQGDIVEDVLGRIGEDLSVDYDEVGDPGLTLNPFTTRGDSWEPGDSIIQRVAAYGDASLNSWGLSVWGSAGTSDGLPKVVFEAWPGTDDWEYECHLADVTRFEDDVSDEVLHNYVAVSFTDGARMKRHRTAEDNADLQDAASMAAYGRRDHVMDIGQGNASLADYVGERYLGYHKDPLPKTALSVVGRLRNKRGTWVAANRVRAGERVKLVDYRGGQVYVLRHTRYDAETGVLEMSPDLPPDDLAILFAQREAGLR